LTTAPSSQRSCYATVTSDLSGPLSRPTGRAVIVGLIRNAVQVHAITASSEILSCGRPHAIKLPRPTLSASEPTPSPTRCSARSIVGKFRYTYGYSGNSDLQYYVCMYVDRRKVLSTKAQTPLPRFVVDLSTTNRGNAART